MIPSSWVHLSTLMNPQLPSLLFQITGTVLETRDGGKMGRGGACEWGGRKGGDKALTAFNELDQSPHHLPASTICPGAYITMSAPDKSQIPTHQQQIVIGIPFMSHHMPSYPLQQKRAPSGWMGGQNFLTSLSPWKELAPFWIHKGELPFVYLNIKRG